MGAFDPAYLTAALPLLWEGMQVTLLLTLFHRYMRPMLDDPTLEIQDAQTDARLPRHREADRGLAPARIRRWRIERELSDARIGGA